MSGSREAILGRIRRALGRREALGEGLSSALDARLENPPVHLKPQLGETSLAERLCSKLEASGASAETVIGGEALVAAVCAFIELCQLPPAFVVAADHGLEALEWPETFRVERRRAEASDRVSVTGAFCGVAEAGSLVLLSGAAHPGTLNFLPDVHIAVLERQHIVPHLEDAWARLREEVDGMPRTVNLVSGPSKTADVEQTIQIGAHGPRRLHVIVFER